MYHFYTIIEVNTSPVLSKTDWLTCRNITSITRVQLHGTFQRSLTSMILLQIVTVISRKKFSANTAAFRDLRSRTSARLI